MIKVDALSIGYFSGKKVSKIVSQGINLSLQSGSLSLLIGPNGTGKSTLLRTLYGIQKPLGGEIFVDGKNIKDISNKSIAKLIGVVLSNAPKIDNFSVKDVVSFGRYPYTNMFGTLSTNDINIVNEAICDVGIENLSDKKFDKLSDGEKQKVMIAKVLAQQTPYIIMDEPMAFLDYKSRLELFDLLKMLAQKMSKGIVISTHNLEMALRAADELWVFDKDSKFRTFTCNEFNKREILADIFDEKTASYLLQVGVGCVEE